MHGYELFSMKDNESIVEMFIGFIDIISGLQTLGKIYGELVKVMKILRSLLKKEKTKVTIIQGAKDLSMFPLEKLIGSLMTHEITIKSHQKVEDKKKKNITLKASIIDEEDEASEEDEDLALIVNKLKKFIKFKKKKENKFQPKKES